MSLIKLKYATFSNGVNTDVDPNIMSVKNATLSYNFFYDSGALKQGYGLQNVKIPMIDGGEEELLYNYDGISFEGAFNFKYYNTTYNKYQNTLMLYGDDNNLYWFSTSPDYAPVMSRIRCNVFTTCPTASVNYRLNNQDVLIFTSAQDGMNVLSSTSSPTTVSTAPKITSMCVHYERLFATVDGEKSTVWYSTELDPTNWAADGTGAGFIEMLDERGCLNKVISFKDYVYIFRDYGITRLTAYADESEFSVAHLYLSSSKIYSNTVCVCGDYVLFLTDNGIYSFNGISTSRLNIPIDNLLKGVDNSQAKACYFNGKYFLALKLNFDDDEILDESSEDCINNSLLAIDVEKGGFTITRGMDIASLCPVLTDEMTKLIVCFHGNNSSKVAELDNSGKYFSSNLPKAWISPMGDLGYPEKHKLIKDIYVSSKYPFTIRVRTDRGAKVYNMPAGRKRLRVNLRTDALAIDFFSSNDLAYISPPKVYLGLV